MQFNSASLKFFRNRANLSQDELAQRIAVSSRSVSRWERKDKIGEPGEFPKKDNLEKLATVLDCKIEDFYAEPPAADAQPTQLRAPKQIKVTTMIDHQRSADYFFVNSVYGVSMQELANMAPLLFTVLAEMSLAQRRQKLEAMHSLSDDLHELLPSYLDDGRSTAGGLHRLIDFEESAIKRKDVFGRHNTMTYQHNNPPIIEFLREQMKSLGLFESHMEDDDAPLGGLRWPTWIISENWLIEFCGRSSRALFAVRHGHAKLSSIPTQLRDEESIQERVAFLENQVPEDVWERRCIELQRPIEELLQDL